MKRCREEEREAGTEREEGKKGLSGEEQRGTRDVFF
jgi:hypothetical protein